MAWRRVASMSSSLVRGASVVAAAVVVVVVVVACESEAWMRSIVRRMVESKDSFSEESGLVGIRVGGGDFGCVVEVFGNISAALSAVSPKMALRRSAGLTPCFSMALVNSSSSLPMSSADALVALGSGFKFPRTEDISDARRAMKSPSESGR